MTVQEIKHYRFGCSTTSRWALTGNKDEHGMPEYRDHRQR